MKALTEIKKDVKLLSEGRMTLETGVSSLLVLFLAGLSIDTALNDAESWVLIILMTFIYISSYYAKHKLPTNVHEVIDDTIEISSSFGNDLKDILNWWRSIKNNDKKSDEK
jgi:hypothetical protein